MFESHSACRIVIRDLRSSPQRGFGYTSISLDTQGDSLSTAKSFLTRFKVRLKGLKKRFHRPSLQCCYIWVSLVDF